MRFESGKLYCFSPPVMLATFAIELVLALYVLIRYKLNKTTRLVAALMVCLAIFQIAEYMVCEGALGISSLEWARLGYVAITLLPPLGLHLGMRIAGVNHKKLVMSSYGMALIFSLIFIAAGQGVSSHVCYGNYVIFEIANWALYPFAAYYSGWVVIGTVLAWRAARATRVHLRRRALYGLILGYMAFILPTTVANIVDPRTIAAIPSIMCGFAILLALILVTWVMPDIAKAESNNKRLKRKT